MRIIKRKTLMEFAKKHADVRSWLTNWYETTEGAQWNSIIQVRKVFPHADAVKVVSGKNVIVFNVKGNEYRLITAIHFNRQMVFVLRFMTHVEYDKDNWKGQL